MGKKKKTTKKTKQLSVAMEEASSSGQPPPISTPRKRGRPRKTVEKADSGEKAGEEPPAAGDAAREAAEDAGDFVVSENESKKSRVTEPQETGTSTYTGEEPRRSSRTRRKSKPRKSS